MEAQGRLQITVVKAVNLKPLQPAEKSEAFATLTVGAQHGYTQAVSTQGQDPVWNETLTLPVAIQPFRRRGSEALAGDSLMVASDALQVEVHERDVLVTESLGSGMLTLGDLPRGIPVPRTLRLGGGRARLMVLLEAQDFGLTEDPPYRGSTGRLKVHVVRATGVSDTTDGRRPDPVVHIAIGMRSVSTQPAKAEMEWLESFEMSLRLWPDTKEAAEPMRVTVYDGKVGEGCLGAVQLDLSKLYEGTLTSKAVLLAGMGKLHLQLEAIDFGIKGGPPSTVRLQEHNMDVGVLQVTLSNFRCTSVDDAADKSQPYFMRITCGDQIGESVVDSHPHWSAAFRVPMPLSLTLSGDRVAAEPIKFEAWRGTLNGSSTLIGSSQPEVAHLQGSVPFDMDLFLDTWSAMHLSNETEGPQDRVSLKVTLEAIDFGLRPTVKQSEPSSEGEFRPGRKYGPLDIQQVEIRAVGACLPQHLEIPAVVEATLTMDGHEECTAPGQACASPHARVWNTTCCFPVHPTATLRLHMVIRGRNSTKTTTYHSMAYAVLSLPEYWDLQPAVEQKKWVDLPGGYRLQLAVKAEHYPFSRAQLRSMKLVVKDAKQLPETSASRWAVQLWWQESPLSVVRTQGRINAKPPIVWNEDFDLLVSPSQSLDLVIAVVEVQTDIDGESADPQEMIEQETLASARVSLANWSLTPNDTVANTVPLLPKKSTEPLTEVLLAARPILFDFLRNDLSVVEVTVTEGRGFSPLLGQQLCVCVMMDDKLVRTPPADAISRPVWGHRCTFDIGPHSTLQLLFTVELADNPTIPVAVGHADLSSWPLQQEVMRGWVLMDTGEDNVDVRLRVNIEARFSLPPPPHRSRESHPSITSSRPASLHCGSYASNTNASRAWGTRRASEPLHAGPGRARHSSQPLVDKGIRAPSLPQPNHSPRSAGTSISGATPPASRDSSLSLSGQRNASSRASTPRSAGSLTTSSTTTTSGSRRSSEPSQSNGKQRNTSLPNTEKMPSPHSSYQSTSRRSLVIRAPPARAPPATPLLTEDGVLQPAPAVTSDVIPEPATQDNEANPLLPMMDSSLSTAVLPRRSSGVPLELRAPPSSSPRSPSRRYASMTLTGTQSREPSPKGKQPRHTSLGPTGCHVRPEDMSREARIRAAEREIARLVAEVEASQKTQREELARRAEARRLEAEKPKTSPLKMPPGPEEPDAAHPPTDAVVARSASTDLKAAPIPPPPPVAGYRAGYRGTAITSHVAPALQGHRQFSPEKQRASPGYRGQPSALMNLVCERREGSVTALRGTSRSHGLSPKRDQAVATSSVTPKTFESSGPTAADSRPSPRLSLPRTRCDAPSPSYALYRTRMASYAAGGSKYFSKKDLAATAAPSSRTINQPKAAEEESQTEAARARQTSLALRRRETGTVHMAPRSSTHVVAPATGPRVRQSLVGLSGARRSLAPAPPGTASTSSNTRHAPWPELSLSERLAIIHRPPGSTDVSSSQPQVGPQTARVSSSNARIGASVERPFSARGLSTQRSDPPVSARISMHPKQQDGSRPLTPRSGGGGGGASGTGKGSSTFL